MSELQAELQTAYENAGFEVGSIGENRGQIRVILVDGTAAAEVVREVAFAVVDEDEVMMMNVTTESVDGQDGMSTVVSFRLRG